MKLQHGRRNILRHFWDIEIRNSMGNTARPDTQKWLDQNAFIDKVANIPEATKNGVLEKWLTYVKSENLTEFLMWRILIMKKNFTLA